MSTQTTSTISLPQAVSQYFAAANAGRIDEATACFTEDAHVHDENNDHRGQAAIRAWIAETTEKFQPKTELLDATESNGSLIATARVSGSFPGSPIELNFSFMLANEKIATLAIH